MDPRSDESLTHFDSEGRAKMVDVGDKPDTKRVATATGRVEMAQATLARILDRSLEKGDVIQVARLAGIMAAKQTSQLIPLCHPLALSKVELDIVADGEASLKLTAQVSLTGKTGVEMEALTAVSVAALTIYDMCKSIDRAMRVTDIQLDHKSGGKSGEFRRTS